MSAPKLLFEEVSYTRQLVAGWVTNWDIHPNGEGFVVVTGTGAAGGLGGGLGEVHVVVNWFEELKARTDG